MAETLSAEPIPGPSTSKVATVTDESEEIAAEAGTSTPVQSTSNGGLINGEGGVGVPDGDVNGGGGEEEKEDPNRIPDDACETLYIQNLNEKVRIPGESHHKPLYKSTDKPLSSDN